MDAFLLPSPIDLVVDASAADLEGRESRRRPSSAPAKPGQAGRFWFAFDRWFEAAAEVDEDFVLA